LTLASSFLFVFLLVGAGAAWAVTPLVAEAAARGDTARLRRVTRMGLWISVIYALFLMPGLIWSRPIFMVLGQEADVSAQAQTYLRIAGWGMFPALLVMVLKSYLAAMERAGIVLWVTIVSALLNGVLDYGLIFGAWGGPEMGIAGAAWASLAMEASGLVLLVIYIVRVLPEHTLFHRLWRFDPVAAGQVFRLAWPIGLTSLAEVGLFSASAILMGWLGHVALAAHGIALQLASLTFMIPLGLSQAATVRAGLAWGRGDRHAVRLGGWVALWMSVAISLCTIALFLGLPDLLVGGFVDPNDPLRPQILAYGVGLLAMAALFQFADGAQVVALGLLRGIQDTAIPMIMATVSYWGVGFVASYVMGIVLGWGGIGVWGGLALGLGTAAVFLLFRFERLSRGAGARGSSLGSFGE
jgi:MATE family multidrug resistance protein